MNDHKAYMWLPDSDMKGLQICAEADCYSLSAKNRIVKGHLRNFWWNQCLMASILTPENMVHSFAILHLYLVQEILSFVV